MQNGSGFRSKSFNRNTGNSGSFRPRFAGNSGGFNRNRFRSSGRSFKRSSGSKIDVSKLINKAIEETIETEYVAKNNFLDFDVHNQIKANISNKGYKTPTPIQDQAIPHILLGKDLVGIAATGTGKTAAFLIPLINKVINNMHEKVLIIVPTRELAMQIQDEFIAFSKGTGVFSVTCIGGTSMYVQFNNLKRRYNFIIGTPGRLKDLANRRAINLNQITNIVLDEVDRMLDMGFIKDIRFLLEQIPTNRQSLFFSATVNREIEGLINSFLNDPVKVSLKVRDTASTVEQDVIRIIDRTKKVEILHDLLIKEEFTKVLIFAKTKMGVRRLSDNLYARGFKVESIHGDKTQARRQKALNMFKQDRVNILVATDVAARGLDISDISHVINYDLPDNYDDYVHRIGRTGRANKRGIALSFVE